MGNAGKIFATLLLVILSVLTAVLAGAGLAIWDMNETVYTVYALTVDHEKNIATQQTIVTSKPDIDDITKIEVGSTNEAADGDNISLDQEIKKGIEPSKKVTSDTTNVSDKGIIEAFSGTEDDSSEVSEEVADETVESGTDSDSDEEKVIITSEISLIKTLVKAGTEENLIPGAEVVLANTENENAENVLGIGEVDIAESQAPSGEYVNPDTEYPRAFTEVGMDYFDDALFIGDSRMQGLGMYSKTNATFYAATAFQLFKYVTFKVVPTANGKIPIFEAMPYDQFTKVYIKVGLNELGCVSDEKFLSDYKEFIDKIRMMQPRAIIYVHAVLPVTATKSATDSTHSNPKIAARNESLKAFAEMNDCYYIDVSSAFTDESGALKADSTADGIHMYGRYMGDWIEYLRTHAIPWQ